MENKKINPSSEDGNNSIPATTLLEQEDELHYAISSGDIDLVKSLLEKPETDVNAFAKGSTENFWFEEFYTSEVAPLFVAIKEHNLEMVKLLVNHPKIDINLGSKRLPWKSYKMTPLIFTLAPIISCSKPVEGESKNSLIEIAKVLLNHPNIDVNAHFLNGATPFQTAVEKIPFDFSDEKKAAKITKLIFARRISDINEKTEDIKEKQNKILEQKKILENKRKEIFSEYSKELSTIDELMEEYFPENKSKCNIF